MYSDGQTEVDAYNPADRSVSFGAVAKGTAWHRPFDVTGVGFGMSWISDAHARYLAMGGVDGFIGDGAPSPGRRGRRRGLLQREPLQGGLALGRLPAPLEPRLQRRPRAGRTSSAGGSMPSSRARTRRLRRWPVVLAAASRVRVARGGAAAGAGVRGRAVLPVGPGRRLVRDGRPRHARRARRRDAGDDRLRDEARCGSPTARSTWRWSRTRRSSAFGFAATYDRFRLYLDLDAPLVIPGTGGTVGGYSLHGAVAGPREEPGHDRRTPASASTRASSGTRAAPSGWAWARSSTCPSGDRARLRHRRHLPRDARASSSPATWASSPTPGSSACTSARSTTRRRRAARRAASCSSASRRGARLPVGGGAGRRSSSGRRSSARRRSARSSSATAPAVEGLLTGRLEGTADDGPSCG